MVDLSVEIAGLRFRNPVWTASGTFGYGLEFSPYLDLNQLGAIVVKGLSLKPSKGNPPPRTVETPAGMLNSIGLQNVGVDAFLKEKLPQLRKFDTHVIANFYGNSFEEYEETAGKLSQAEGISALEMNISCPNVKEGNLPFGRDPKVIEELVGRVRKAVKLPLIVKLSPNTSDIKSAARSAEQGGADALSAINTLIGMSVDVRTKKPRLAKITGGLSGPAIRPVAVRMVWEAASAVKIPVIGIGGIVSAEDALEFMIVGAKAVQIGTANFLDPAASVKIIEGLRDFCEKEQVERVRDLIGAVRV
ncbi:MAG: dihydroorotate dehydrogenase [Nitrospinae bacterium]|nr:dihydroorotate dehydrogenase [Nitrospinota bacterium]